MKKVIAILVVVLGFAFNTNAQDKMMKKETVKTVSLEQTKGEFTQKQITLSEGTYVFEVSNNDAAPQVGLVLIEDGKDGSKPENHIKNAYVSKMVKHGKKESSKKVTLKKGTYKYFCPFNKTPQYTLVVK
ncbi:Cupredoxin-like domain-containing protein [Lutibacter sp. Hel_I_33_5]|uniref:cupredoxin domain-containing protein n=1 Tax=Lutibacter sp. Hel_I_33_5 TaxID=1566289 RepID=UPI00119CBF99|nr:cupredoxin domain-containing protein [Lutibacter sp. Hel_I_33_5]TVZ56445.1 Cupredoxin-like domain-containing protein [Lutibacter sp. Hel_I_33_5]